MKKSYKRIIGIPKEIAKIVNDLLEIEDFELEKERLENLGFREDSTAIEREFKVEGYIFTIAVHAGQTNAWIDTAIICPDGEVISSEPAFGPIEGDYIVETDDIKINVTVKII